ncbi:MAG: nanoRNase/pAp phosphatase (c-di-AMP/oligoRNAs hydrolase), partial [Gammaproteobacteria bacterium]
DFDGLVCASLLRHMELVGDIFFAHPKDMQDGNVDITAQDITTNLPYVPSAHLAFDHHISETLRITGHPENLIIDPSAPSAARVVFDYYRGFESFPFTWDQMMEAVDKADSANFSREDILYPKGWTLLSFLMDSRTGFGRFHNFSISNHQLMMDLVDYCRFKNIDDIFSIPDVAERVSLYDKQQQNFVEQVQRCARVVDDIVILDLRNEVTIFPGNRFMIYALFPQARLSVHALWGLSHATTVLAVGKSIIDRTSPLNVGELMLSYGGGGHGNAGTCQVPSEQADRTLGEIIAAAAASVAPLGDAMRSSG